MKTKEIILNILIFILLLMSSYLGENYEKEVTLKENIIKAYEYSISEIIRVNHCKDKEIK